MYTYLEFNKDSLNQSEIQISTIFENCIVSRRNFYINFPHIMQKNLLSYNINISI